MTLPEPNDPAKGNDAQRPQEPTPGTPGMDAAFPQAQPAPPRSADAPANQLASTTVQVGCVTYVVRLVHGWLDAEGLGDELLGMIDFTRCEILISDVPPVQKRRNTFWHELAHAWEHELDVHGRPFADESFANVVGLGMAKITQRKLRDIETVLSADERQKRGRDEGGEA